MAQWIGHRISDFSDFLVRTPAGAHFVVASSKSQGYPLKFYFRGHKIPLSLILEDIWGDFEGQLYNI